MIQTGATDSRRNETTVKDDTSSENAGSASCSSSDAAQISCLELDAWIRDDDEAMDCMMILPDVDSAEAEEQSMRGCEEQQKSCTCCDSQECRQMIFCRSSSNCSSTFPDDGDSCGDQETLELTLPDDFFDDKQMQQQQHEISPSATLPALRESKHLFAADLKKIIVKKPVMDKAVERLGGGRRGAMRLWNIIQVWLRYQQQTGSPPLDMLPFENFGGNFVNGNGMGYQNPPQDHRNVQNPQVFRDPNAVMCSSFGELSNNMGFQPQQQQSSVFCSYGDPANPSSMVPDCPRTSAASTRAARKSRMARQRRHRAGGSGAIAPPAGGTSPAAPCSWSSSGFMGTSAATATQGVRDQSFVSRDVKTAGRVGCDKSAKFLLQKELKPSDVGNLGRIVLPKKEAEIHLPYLNLREGITIAMEDMVTTHTWHFRYRFWPNNKSRMYLLEGTGEFVKTHQLREGDLLQIHRECKTGKYMIYGKTVVKQQRLVEEDSLSAASTVSEDASEPYSCSDGIKSCTVEQEVSEDGIERLSSIEEMGSDMGCEMGDEFIEEILGMVEAEEPSSPESGREDS